MLELLVVAVQAIEDRVVFGTVDGAMPGIGAGLGDDINHGTRVSPIFRGGIACNSNILIDKIWVG